MYSQLIIIIILLILLIGTISILKREYIYFSKYENVRILNNIPISNLYDNLKSGDIILFKCNTTSLSSTILTHVYYTHIGMVIKPSTPLTNMKSLLYNNEEIPLYISETNPAFEYLPLNYDRRNDFELKPSNDAQHKGWRTNYGTDILPLLVRLKYYPGDCFIMSLNKKLDSNRESLLLKYAQESCPYPNPIQGIKILIEQQFGKQKTNARHCYQHVANLLDKINITNNILHQYKLFSICKKIAYIYGEELNDGYMYNTPIKIIYDI